MRNRPTYNHSREDSELIPCSICAATPAERELGEALRASRTEVARLERQLRAAIGQAVTLADQNQALLDLVRRLDMRTTIF